MKIYFTRGLLMIWIILLLFTWTAQASVKSAQLVYDHGFVTLKPGRFSVLTILSRLAGTANIEIYITEKFSDFSRQMGFERIPVHDMLCTLLKGYSFAVLYMGDPAHPGQVYFSGGGSSFRPAEETLALKTAGSGPSFNPLASHDIEPSENNLSQASGRFRASGSAESSRPDNNPRPESRELSRAAGLSSTASGFSSTSTGSGSSSPDPGGSAEAGIDNESDEATPENNNIPAQEDSSEPTAYLEYKIRKLQEDIESGRADQWYNHWAQIKDPRYIINPRDELARYQKELSRLKTN